SGGIVIKKVSCPRLRINRGGPSAARVKPLLAGCAGCVSCGENIRHGERANCATNWENVSPNRTLRRQQPLAAGLSAGDSRADGDDDGAVRLFCARPYAFPRAVTRFGRSISRGGTARVEESGWSP